MANLNLQAPPRNIARDGSLSGRSVGGFSSSLSGHVTPTSGMFQGSSSYGQSQAPPQLSPNRNTQLAGGNTIGTGAPVPQQLGAGGRVNMFSQRSFADRRPMPGIGGGPMSNMGSFMQSSRGYGSQTSNSLSNYHVFGSGNAAGDTVTTPPLLDLSEFPSLTNARGNSGQSDHSLLSQSQSNPLQPPGSKPYVGMVKQPTSEQSEFQMSNEDFPALPGTQISDGLMNQQSTNGAQQQQPNNSNTNQLSSGSNMANNVVMNMMAGGHGMMNMDGSMMDKGPAGAGGMDLAQGDSSLHDKLKRGVQTHPDGKVTNIPASMVNNQFGMVGLLTFIRAAESDPNLVTLAMGQDLTGLGLNLSSQENLHPTFGGPFADHPCRPQDIDFNVPPEYLVNTSIRDKLASVTLKKYNDDLLFFLFYTSVGDFMQLAAATELFNRDWRYHIDEKAWIMRIPGSNQQYEKLSSTSERGTFYYFDVQNWRQVVKPITVDQSKIDRCPNTSSLNNTQL